jgi:hypothetical protein
LDAIEAHFGDDAAEQAAHLFEDKLADHDQFNVEALREIEAYLEGHMGDPSAEYIRNQAHTMIKVLEDDAYLTEATKVIKLEMSLSAQLALAVGSSRAELVPTPERIAKSFQPDEDTTVNEKALMTNLRGWIEMACEGAKVVIETKDRAAKLEERAESAEMRLRVIGVVQSAVNAKVTECQRIVNGSLDDDEVAERHDKMGISW